MVKFERRDVRPLPVLVIDPSALVPPTAPLKNVVPVPFAIVKDRGDVSLLTVLPKVMLLFVVVSVTPAVNTTAPLYVCAPPVVMFAPIWIA